MGRQRQRSRFRRRSGRTDRLRRRSPELPAGRVATEAYLETARSRVSLRRHALLVDYHVHDGCNARAWIQLNVSGNPGDAVFLDRTLTRFYTFAPGMPSILAVGAGNEEAALSERRAGLRADARRGALSGTQPDAASTPGATPIAVSPRAPPRPRCSALSRISSPATC